jgi:hypothetical protein
MHRCEAVAVRQVGADLRLQLIVVKQAIQLDEDRIGLIG